MAPFQRGGRGRGRVATGFRGRGRNSSRAKHRGSQRSTFHSTRVEEPKEDAPDGNEISTSETVDDIVETSRNQTSESELDHDSIIVDPYSSLLQSLKGSRQGKEPPQKKRRVTLEEHPRLEVVLPISNAQSDEADVDRVDKREESGLVTPEDIENGENMDDSADALDTFELHFASPEESVLTRCIKDVESLKWQRQNFISQSEWKVMSSTPLVRSLLPTDILDPITSLCNLQVKQRLVPLAEKLLPSLIGINGHLAASIYSYQDILFCDRTVSNAQDLQWLTSLHALNHIFKTRDRVIKDNVRTAKLKESEDVEFRDQGFTRPKVLMLLPTRQACVKAVNSMMSLSEPEQQENKKRFQESYAQDDDHFSEDKPQDFRDLFAGNDDDMFRLGIKFTRKTVKFFSQFYNSDIILASPLGLRMAIGSEDGTQKQDYDFLSSIEIVIVDQADALLMQNWEHVEYVFDHLNLQPRETHGCDFSRVRNWYLDGNAKYLRQTIILSAFNTPEINKLHGRYMLNVAGKLKICKGLYDGIMVDLGTLMKQTFSRFDAIEPSADPDARFKYFTTAIVPMISKFSKSSSGRGQGIVLFIPSYMDFVRLRNFLANSTDTQSVSFGSISEYTSVGEVARARSHFFSGRHSVLLYTGRAHHFRRYRIRGAKQIIMYSLPDNPIFYHEIAGGFLLSSISEARVSPGESSIRSIFSKWDALKLERIVGTRRMPAMIKEKGGDTFDFV